MVVAVGDVGLLEKGAEGCLQRERLCLPSKTCPTIPEGQGELRSSSVSVTITQGGLRVHSQPQRRASTWESSTHDTLGLQEDDEVKDYLLHVLDSLNLDLKGLNTLHPAPHRWKWLD